MTLTVIRSQSNRTSLGCGGMGGLHYGCGVSKSAATCYHPSMDEKKREMFPSNLLIYTLKKEFWRQKGGGRGMG